MKQTAPPIAKPKKGKATASFGFITAQCTDGKKVSANRGGRSAETGQPLIKTVTGVKTGRREDMLNNIKKGLKFASIGQLEVAYGATQKEVAAVLSIPRSTLLRRRRDGRLLADESDRVVRLARIKDAALTLMDGDDGAAVDWLRTPLDILGGETPFEHASTEMGARDVEDLIGRLRHGVFS